jgi:hypothetical protein
MLRLSSSLVAAILLLTVLSAPSLGLALGASSMTAGTLLVAGLLVALATGLILVGGPMAFQPPRCLGMVVALLSVGLHGAICWAISPAFDLARSALSFLFLLILLAGGFAASLLAETLKDEDLGWSAWIVLGALSLTALIGATGFSPFFPAETHAKPVMFFSEPSHFALDFLPLLLFATVVGKRSAKVWLILLGLALALLMQNTTLMVGTILVAMVTLQARRAVLVIAVLLVMIAFAGAEVLDYYGSRLDLSGDSTNLSVLAFLQGWERSLLNFRETFGLGVGFQQFGIVGSRGEIQEAMSKLGMEDMNLFDGTTVASKLIAELGIIGLAILAAYVAAAVKAVRMLRRISIDGVHSVEQREVLGNAIILMYSIDLFVRGVGYFSSSSLLLAAALWSASARRSVRAGPQVLIEIMTGGTGGGGGSTGDLGVSR